MNRSGRLVFGAALLLPFVGAVAATAPPPSIPNAIPDASAQTVAAPAPGPKIDRIITAMNHASTLGHPDLFGEFAGMRLYSHRDYQSAIRYFKYAARYADKLSQLSIGLMYANGRGVTRDPVTACAWLALAAERNYPSFIATRDRVCKTLTIAQHDEAVAVLDSLLPEYGDQVAKQRLVKAMNLAKTQITGSRLGFDGGVNAVSTSVIDQGITPADCGGPSVGILGVPVPVSGCGGLAYYAPSLRDPSQYFAARDARWRGIVTVGSTGDANASGKSQSAAASSSDR